MFAGRRGAAGGGQRRKSMVSTSADQRFAMLVALLAVLVSIVGLCVRFAPVFTVSILGILVIVLTFMSTERSKTHAFIEFQNRFWSFAAFILAWVCFFIRDSPLCFADQQRSLAWAMTLLVSYTAHTYHRWLVRRWLYIVPPLPRVDSADIRTELKISARQKIAAINSHIPTIDNPLVSSTFQNIFNIFNVLHAEEAIISIFADATQDELNFILQDIQLGLILYKMKDHKWWRRYNRDKLLRVLAVTRLHELDERSKVYLLHGIQSLTLSASDTCERHVEKIICSTKSDKLSELKSLADAKGDVHNMHKLVYSDIQSPEVKRRILAHIKTQADIIKAHHDMRSRNKMQALGQYAWRKIISDVDDTLTCSGGANESLGLAGLDVSYPAKTVYPGVLAFYRELDLGTSGSGVWDDSKVGNLVFLSARPHVYKDATEGRSYLKFQKLKKQRGGLHTMPTLLAGALETGLKFAYGGDAEPLAVTKYKNLGEYLALYPEYKVIFVGDNGQGDVRAAEMALLNPQFAGNISRVYVHLVQAQALTHRAASLEDHERSAEAGRGGQRERGAGAVAGGASAAAGDQSAPNPAAQALRALERRRCLQIEQERMCFFVTYADAALDAHKRGLIRSTGLRNVMVESARDFLSIEAREWAEDEVRMRNLKYTQAQGQGAGGKILPQTGRPSRAGGGAQAPSASGVSSVWACQGEAKRDTRVRELNLSLQRGNEVLAAAGLPPVPLLPRKLTVGSRVKTEYGLAVVTRVRALQHAGAEPAYYGATYELLVQWDCSGTAPPTRLYLQDWGVVSLPPVMLQTPTPKYFRGAGKPAPVTLTSAVNVPSYSPSSLSAPPTGVSRKNGLSGTPAATPTSATSKFGMSGMGLSIGLLTRENVAAVATAKPLVPLYERGEGSVSSMTSVSARSNKAPTPEIPSFSREEDVPSIEHIVQTSVFKPSVLDRARAAPIFHRGRNRARSSSNVSSEDGTGQSSVADRTDRNLAGMRGAQAWSPYGLVQVMGYADDDLRRDCVLCRMHGRLEGYVEMSLQRSCLVQLTDPALTTCYEDDEILLDDPQSVPPLPDVSAAFESVSSAPAHASSHEQPGSASGRPPLARPAASRASSFAAGWASGIFGKPAPSKTTDTPSSAPVPPVSTPAPADPAPASTPAHAQATPALAPVMEAEDGEQG